MNPAPFRSAREAFLRFPSRPVNFFFRFSENFFSASPEAFRRREIPLYENFASPVKTFFQFRDAFASFAVSLNRRRRTLRRCPPFVKLFVESFLFFLIEGGRGTLSLARKGFPFPPQTPPIPSQTRFLLENETARNRRRFPVFNVPRKGTPSPGNAPPDSLFLLLFSMVRLCYTKQGLKVCGQGRKRTERRRGPLSCALA